MASRNATYTIRLDGREVAVIKHLQVALGGRDKASVIRSLIWEAGLRFGVLTTGDVADLATLEDKDKNIQNSNIGV